MSFDYLLLFLVGLVFGWATKVPWFIGRYREITRITTSTIDFLSRAKTTLVIPRPDELSGWHVDTWRGAVIGQNNHTGDHWAVWQDDDTVICLVGMDPPSRSIAHLMSAAPELLDACLMVRDAFGPAQHWPDIMRPALMQAEAALAKAQIS